MYILLRYSVYVYICSCIYYHAIKNCVDFCMQTITILFEIEPILFSENIEDVQKYFIEKCRLQKL